MQIFNQNITYQPSIKRWIFCTVFLGLQIYEAIAAIFWHYASYVFVLLWYCISGFVLTKWRTFRKTFLVSYLNLMFFFDLYSNVFYLNDICCWWSYTTFWEQDRSQNLTFWCLRTSSMWSSYENMCAILIKGRPKCIYIPMVWHRLWRM